MADEKPADKFEGEHNPIPVPVSRPIKDKVGAGVPPTEEDEHIHRPPPHEPPRRREG